MRNTFEDPEWLSYYSMEEGWIILSISGKGLSLASISHEFSIWSLYFFTYFIHGNKLHKPLSEWRPTKISCATPNDYTMAWFWHFKQQYEAKIQYFLDSGDLSLDLNKK